MLSFLNEDFYHKLSRRELRDLLWATESSATSPNAILIALVETETGVSKKTFVAPTSGDLAGFCEDVVRCIKKMTELNVESPAEDNATTGSGMSPRNIHLIYSEHPHCLWKLSLNIIETSLRSPDFRVVQHRFSAVWKKKIEVLHS